MPLEQDRVTMIVIANVVRLNCIERSRLVITALPIAYTPGIIRPIVIGAVPRCTASRHGEPSKWSQILATANTRVHEANKRQAAPGTLPRSPTLGSQSRSSCWCWGSGDCCPRL